MKFNIQEIKKVGMYIFELFILMGLGSILGVFLCDFVIKGIVGLVNADLLSNPCYETFMQYFYNIGIWIVFIAYFSNRKLEKGLVDILGKKCRGNNILCFIAGLLIGFGTNFICGYMAMRHGDIAIEFVSFKPLQSLLVFIAIFFQSGAEEILCRGVLYQKLVRRYGDGLKPILITSLLFASLHLFNEGITVISFLNLILAGIVPALMIYYFDSMWMCIAEHTAWNFTQNILLGLPNSGIRVPFSIFALSTDTVRDSFFYNVGFGIEGSAFSVIVLLVVIGVMYLLMNNKRKPGYDVWQGISEAEVERDEQEKSDAKTLKQIEKYTAKDYKKKLKKDPDYTYEQLLDYEVEKEIKGKKGIFPRLIIVILLTTVLFVFVLPDNDIRQIVSIIVGELMGFAFAIPYSMQLTDRRIELVKKYLGEKIAEEKTIEEV